ncbi:MAG: hypothetical protein HY763_07430 [Planctomycetes bacterium]|nr:hypothetical protein [Planctomycetota bacterium]
MFLSSTALSIVVRLRHRVSAQPPRAARAWLAAIVAVVGSAPSGAWALGPPSNDTCGTAIQISEGAFVGTNAGAGGDGAASCVPGGQPASPDVWWQYTASSTATALIETCGSDFDTVVNVFDACGGAELACDDDDDACGLDSRQSRIMFTAQQGGTYWVRVAGYSGEVGEIRLRIALLPPPANDDCADAPPVSEGTFFGTSLGASTDATASCGGVDLGSLRDVWWRYVPSGSGTAEIDTCGSGFDTVLSAYDSCGGAELACNDDEGQCGATGTQSRVIVPAVQGQPVWVRVAGFEGDAGSVTLTIVLSTVPASDRCVDAQVVGEGTFVGTNAAASTDDVASCGFDGEPGSRDVWWRYIPAFTGTALVATCSSAPDTIVSVLDDCGGAELACNDDSDACGDDSVQSLLYLPVSTGSPVLIRVAGYEGDTGTIRLYIGPPPGNDRCSAATPVAEGTHRGTNIGSDTDGLASCGAFGDAGAHDIWWRYTPTADGLATLETCASGFDTVLSAQAGCGGAELGCDEDSESCGPGSTRSRMQLPVRADMDYLVRVAGFAGEAGAADLAISLGPAATLCGDFTCNGGERWSGCPRDCRSLAEVAEFQLCFSHDGPLSDECRYLDLAPNGAIDLADFVRMMLGYSGP